MKRDTHQRQRKRDRIRMNKHGRKASPTTSSVLRFKEYGQEYAHVREVIGSSKVRCMCSDGTQRICVFRGRLRYHGVFINVGDLVLVDLREYQNQIADIVHRYSLEEAKKLEAYGEIEAELLMNDCDEEEISFGDSINRIHAKIAEMNDKIYNEEIYIYFEDELVYPKVAKSDPADLMVVPYNRVLPGKEEGSISSSMKRLYTKLFTRTSGDR